MKNTLWEQQLKQEVCSVRRELMFFKTIFNSNYSGSVLVYVIDTTTGSMQLSHRLELTPKHYPGITPSLFLLFLSVFFLQLCYASLHTSSCLVILDNLHSFSCSSPGSHMFMFLLLQIVSCRSKYVAPPIGNTYIFNIKSNWQQTNRPHHSTYT